MRNDLTSEVVRERFSYDPDEGMLRYRQATVRHCRIVPEGSVAGGLNKEGYRYVMVRGIHYRASRIIWLYMTGSWPKHKIDHKNCNTSDDRWENLRQATDSQQKQNNRKRKDNKTGYKCVVYCKEPRYKHGRFYRWQVVVDGKRIKSGARYATAEEAYAAYCARLVEFHGEFANPGVAP